MASVQQKRIFFENLRDSEKGKELSTLFSHPKKDFISDGSVTLERPKGFLAPPQKPKRTFEHDIYLDAKMCVSAPCSSRASSCVSMQSNTTPNKESGPGRKMVAYHETSPTILKGHPRFFQLSHEYQSKKGDYDGPRPLEVSFRKNKSNENIYATPLFTPKMSLEQPPNVYSQQQSLYYASADISATSSTPNSKNLQQTPSSTACNDVPKDEETPKFRKINKSQLSRKFAFNCRKSVRDSVSSEQSLCSNQLESADKQIEATPSDSLERRVSRARLVRRRTLALYDHQVQAFVSRKAPQLFETAFLVELQQFVKEIDASASPDEKEVEKYYYKPIITYRYPAETQHNSEPPELFFPDYSRNCVILPNEHWEGDEEFVIALTNNVAERKNAYCIKFLPERTEGATCPKVFVVVSPIKNSNFYLDLARNAIGYAKTSRKSLDSFLRSVFHQEYPQKRGSCLVVLEKEASGIMKRVEIRNLGTALGKQGVSLMMERLTPEFVVCVVAALLGDQRVLIGGHSVSIVAHAVQCLEALIHPFIWPHTYVPVVPDNLYDLAHNPTPYLMGILRNNLAPLRELIVDEEENNNDKIQMDFMFVDIDNGLINPRPKNLDCGKDKEQSEAWRAANANAYCQKLGVPKKASNSLMKGFRGAMQGGPGPAADARIENAMLHWYALLFGHYKTVGAHTEWGDKMKAKLVQSHPDPKMRPYLAYLCETAMFTEWVEKKQKQSISSGSSEEVPGSEEALNKKLDEIAASQSSSSLRPLSSLVNKMSSVLHLSGSRKK